jgi:hypothetical protein
MALLIEKICFHKDISSGGECAHNKSIGPQGTPIKEDQEQGSRVAVHAQHEETAPRAPG